MFSQLCQLFFYMDFLGMKPQLLMSGSKRHVTVLGVISSLLVLSFILGFSLFFFVRLFQRQVFLVNPNQGKIEFPLMNLTNYPIVLKLVDGSLAEIPQASKYYTYQVGLVHVPGHNGPAIRSWTTTEPCNIEKHFGNYKAYFETIADLSTYSCIVNLNTLNFTVFGTYGDMINGYGAINIIINMCNNATSNNTCAAQSDINSKLKAVFVNYGSLDYLVDHNNIENPSNLTLNMDLLPISGTIFTRYYYYKRSVNYQTDYGMVFPDVKQENFFQQDDRQTYVDLSVNLGGDTAVVISGVKFGHISIHMNNIKYTYFRSYQKIQEMLASIGGVMSAVMFLGYILVNFVGRRVYNIKLANVFFQFSQDSKLHRTVSDLMVEMKQSKMGLSKMELSKRDMAKKNKNEGGIEKAKTNENEFSAKIANYEEKPIFLQNENNVNTDTFAINIESPFGLQDIMGKSTKNKVLMNKGDENIPNEDISSVNNKKHGDNEKINEFLENTTVKTRNYLYNFDDRIDENGKLKMNIKNMFFPNEGITKIVEIMDKKSSIDEILKYCSEIEKIKKYLFDEEDLLVFNNLPDLDLIDVIHTKNNKGSMIKSVGESIRRLQDKNPESKLLKLMIR